jgi:hypothetical protein
MACSIGQPMPIQLRRLSQQAPPSYRHQKVKSFLFLFFKKRKRFFLEKEAKTFET